jgi:hypothetical protein
VIRDFCVVPIDGDKTFGARVNFVRDRVGAAPDHPTPNPDIRGSPIDSSGSESSVSSGSSASGSGGPGDGGSKSGSFGNDDRIGGIRGLLPSTGVMVLGALVVGTLLAGGGLLILRHAR